MPFIRARSSQERENSFPKGFENGNGNVKNLPFLLIFTFLLLNDTCPGHFRGEKKELILCKFGYQKRIEIVGSMCCCRMQAVGHSGNLGTGFLQVRSGGELKHGWGLGSTLMAPWHLVFHPFQDLASHSVCFISMFCYYWKSLLFSPLYLLFQPKHGFYWLVDFADCLLSSTGREPSGCCLVIYWLKPQLFYLWVRTLHRVSRKGSCVPPDVHGDRSMSGGFFTHTWSLMRLELAGAACMESYV